MKFNIYFTFTGPSGRIIEAPNNTNPVECVDLRTLLEKLSESLPCPFGVTPIGLRVELAE